MRSRCGSYQRRARSRSTGHSEYRRLPKVSTKSFQRLATHADLGEAGCEAVVGRIVILLDPGGVALGARHARDVAVGVVAEPVSVRQIRPLSWRAIPIC